MCIYIYTYLKYMGPQTPGETPRRKEGSARLTFDILSCNPDRKTPRVAARGIENAPASPDLGPNIHVYLDSK